VSEEVNMKLPAFNPLGWP